MDERQTALPAFMRQLLAYGYGLYSIDYTKDFLGVLDGETLVKHLCAVEVLSGAGNALRSHVRSRSATIHDNSVNSQLEDGEVH